MTSYDYILFDLDGTLTDPGIGVTNAVMHALRRFGINVEDRAELYRFIGPPLTESFQNFYQLTPEQAAEAITEYRAYYAPKGIFECEVYAGIPEALQRLKNAGRRLIVATCKPEPFALRVLDHFQLTDCFDFVSGASMDESTLKWEVIRNALLHFGITDPKNVLMVGDRKHDILGAKTCGITARMGVLYGYGSREELENAGANLFAESPAQIADLILGIQTE